MVCFLLPINLYQTIDTQSHGIDSAINLGLTMMFLADILFGIVLMTLTKKQKICFKRIGNSISCPFCNQAGKETEKAKTNFESEEELVSFSSMEEKEKI
jgi:hypothetical protein